MDRARITQELLARAPHLRGVTHQLNSSERKYYVNSMITEVIENWTRTSTTSAGGNAARTVAAMHAAVGTAWRWGHPTGAQTGSAIVADYVAASALDASEPARGDMSDHHRDLANRLHAARVSTSDLRRYLIAADARHVNTWRGGDIFDLRFEAEIVEVLVPAVWSRGYALRMLDAADAIAWTEDRAVTAVLTDLALPPSRPPLTHAASRYLWQVYETATEFASLPPRTTDPGPTDLDYATALADAAEDSDIHRVVTATLVGHDNGMRHGHSAGASWASNAITSRVLFGSADTVSIGHHTAPDWLQAAINDACKATDAVRVNPHHNPVPFALPAAHAFPHLRSVDPSASADTNEPPSAPASPPPRPHR